MGAELHAGPRREKRRERVERRPCLTTVWAAVQLRKYGDLSLRECACDGRAGRTGRLCCATESCNLRKGLCHVAAKKRCSPGNQNNNNNILVCAWWCEQNSPGPEGAEQCVAVCTVQRGIVQCWSMNYIHVRVHKDVSAKPTAIYWSTVDFDSWLHIFVVSLQTDRQGGFQAGTYYNVRFCHQICWGSTKFLAVEVFRQTSRTSIFEWFGTSWPYLQSW